VIPLEKDVSPHHIEGGRRRGKKRHAGIMRTRAQSLVFLLVE